MEQLSAQKDFWSRADAKSKLRELSLLKKEIEKFSSIEKLKEDLKTMLALVLDEDEMLDYEIIPLIEDGEEMFNEWEVERYLSGEYDALNAFISFSSGAGGTDAQDWTQMLLKMYVRWAERHSFNIEILEEMPGDEAGIKSALLHVKGDFAYGLLKGETGVHRLVRISPFDANKRRHTSFALVEITPEIEDTEIEIDEKDLKIDIFRASGHGGQNVQKVETAVRIVHLPTGIKAECQNERSQLQNKIMAMKVLKSRLVLYERKKREEKLREIKGTHKSAEWGNEIRSYVLQPYKMVKDHRTGVETGRVDDVLNGDLDEFIWAYLKSQKKTA